MKFKLITLVFSFILLFSLTLNSAIASDEKTIKDFDDFSERFEDQTAIFNLGIPQKGKWLGKEYENNPQNIYGYATFLTKQDPLSDWKISKDYIFNVARRAFLKNGLIFKNFNAEKETNKILSYTHNGTIQIGFGNAGMSYLIRLDFVRFGVLNEDFKISRGATTYSNFHLGHDSSYNLDTVKNSINELIDEFAEEYINANKNLIKNPFE
jgi:hypothetical protein